MAYERLTSEDQSMAAVAGASNISISAASSRLNSIADEEETTENELPRSAYHIIMVEGCERFCFSGLKVILLFYFMHFFHTDRDTATVYYHTFSCACHLTPIFGAILSDGYIGRYWTILLLSIVYFIGASTLAVTSVPQITHRQSTGPIIGLLLVAFGTGGIKPCVGAFGADQISTSNVKQLSYLFTFYYFTMNIGALISAIITPILRSDVQCFGYDCYPLAFGVPALLMLIAIIIFIMGTPIYIRVAPKENIITKFLAIIWRAIGNGIFRSTSESKENFLDYADDKYSVDDIQDVRRVLQIFLLLTPLVVYNALQNQKGSRWTFQASLMDGHLGPFGTIKPDQMQGISYVMLLLFIPLFERVIYPAAARFNWFLEPLQRIYFGLILTIGAFIAAAIVQEAIQTKENAVPVRLFVHIYNGYNCPVYINYNTTLESGKIDQFPCKELLAKGLVFTPTCDTQDVFYKLSANQFCPSALIVSETSNTTQNTKIGITPLTNPISRTRGVNEYALLRLVSLNDASNVTMKTLPNQYVFNLQQKLVPTEYQSVLEHAYKIKNMTSGQTSVESFYVSTTAVYTVLLVNTKDNKLHAISFEDVPSFTVHILWQIIQYALLTASEILVSITVLIFAYAEAPKRYKVVILSFSLLIASSGDLLVIFVASVHLTENQALEFLLFALAMAFSTFLFGALAIDYQAKHLNKVTDATSEDQHLLTGKNLSH